MTMKLTAFLGSPRARGNTDTLAAQVVKGAKEAGLETETVALRKLQIRPCTGCEKCWKKGRPCVFDDDMAALYDTIAGTDILLFATPLYWYAPTALMKAFMDRLVPFNHPQGRPLIEGKGAILAVAYEEEKPEVVEPLMRMFEMGFDYLGVRLLDRVVAPGVGPKGAILQKPEVLAQAYEIGRRLGEPES